MSFPLIPKLGRGPSSGCQVSCLVDLYDSVGVRAILYHPHKSQLGVFDGLPASAVILGSSVFAWTQHSICPPSSGQYPELVVG